MHSKAIAKDIKRNNSPFISATDFITTASLDGEEHKGCSMVTCDDAILQITNKSATIMNKQYEHVLKAIIIYYA